MTPPIVISNFDETKYSLVSLPFYCRRCHHCPSRVLSLCQYLPIWILSSSRDAHTFQLLFNRKQAQRKPKRQIVCAVLDCSNKTKRQ